MKVPFEKVLEKAQSYKADMVKFLRDMVAIPSESCQEKEVVLRIKQEMEKVGFDKVVIDPMGNILGYIGHGKHLIGMDAHIDTVGIGEIKTGPLILIKDLKMMSISVEEELVTKKVVWPQWSTLLKSSKI